MSFSLEDYKIQREYREKKRKQYLHQFEMLRAKMQIFPSQQKASHAVNKTQSHGQGTHDTLSREKTIQESLIEQNNKLKQQLSELDKHEREQLELYKKQITQAKQSYMTQIKQVNELGNTQKHQTLSKIKKIEQQIKAVTQKNQQITIFNTKMEDECKKVADVMSKYTQEIQKEYDQKLEEFSKIYNSSTEKISAMENQYDDTDFVESTLQSQELIQSIRENAEKADEDIDKISEDYKQLLKGKQQICHQLSENNKMKEDQINKMAALEQKLKTIFQKLNEQKKIYMEQNSKMASELMEVKELLSKAMGS